MLKNPERCFALGVPELVAQIRQTNRAVGHLGGWGNRKRSAELPHGEGVLSGTGVPNGSPNNEMLEWPRRYIPLCIRSKRPVRRYNKLPNRYRR